MRLKMHKMIIYISLFIYVSYHLCFVNHFFIIMTKHHDKAS